MTNNVSRAVRRCITRDIRRLYSLPMQEPHPWAQYVIDHAERFNAITCGRRFGKTEGIGLDRIIDGALKGWPCAWFAPSYKLLMDPWRAAVRLLLPVTRRRDATERRIELVTGGSIDFWTLDTPDAGRGRKYKRAIVDEAAMIKELERALHAALFPTLSDLSGDLWLLTTPRGFNQYYDLMQKFGAMDDGFSIRLDTYKNPYISLAEIEILKSIMSPKYFAQEILASFESLAERILHQFDFFTNTLPAVDAPRYRPPRGKILVGMDFNVNPMTATIGYLNEIRIELAHNSPERNVEIYDELIIFDELELHDSGTDEMCTALKNRYPDRVDDLVIYPDPTGRARHTESRPGVTNFTIIQSDHNLPMYTNGIPLREDKFNEMNALSCNAKGQRRLKVTKNCKKTLQSFEQYTYKDGTSEPDKGKWDHLFDCAANIVHCEFPMGTAHGAVDELYGVN